ncbi:MAG: hypothetical protein CFE44_22670, partial [Burkholderiales bacterium PBB4]
THTLPLYYFGKDPAWSMGSSYLFGLNARADDRWLTSPAGQAEWGKFAAAQGVESWPLGAISGRAELPSQGTQAPGVYNLTQSWWCKRPITGLSALRGLRVRLGGADQAIWERLGVLPHNIPGGEIFKALENGTLDCTAWFTPYDDARLGFNRQAAYLVHWGPNEGRSSIQTMLLANARALESLPPAYRAALDGAAVDANTWMQAQYEAQNLPAL